MDGIKVSVAILTYFHEYYIERSLKSALSQITDFDYEIVLSDDCSKDQTIEIIKKYRDLYPEKIRLIEHKENVGICRNEYDNWIECKGEYIVILAGDDAFCDDNKLQRQVEFLEKNRKYVAVGTRVKTVYSDGTDAGEIIPCEAESEKEIKKEEFLKVKKYPVHGIMFRNVLKTKEGREKFSLMYKFSKYIDDLTMSFFFFDFGRIFITNDVTYALTVRRKEDLRQHNYNSLFKQTQRAVDSIEVLKNIYDYYDHKINLFYWFENPIVNLLSGIIKYKERKFSKYLKYVPFRYILLAIIRWPYMRKRYK